MTKPLKTMSYYLDVLDKVGHIFKGLFGGEERHILSRVILLTSLSNG